MPDVIVNVTPQPTASVEVDVDNVASYYYELAKKWAISPNLVEQLDYSSKYYANVSKGYKEDVDDLLSDSGFIAVSQDLANIDTVAGSITNVNSVASDLTNIDTVASNLSGINTVVDNITDINTCSFYSTQIVNCSGNINAIKDVSERLTYIVNISNDLTNIDSVAGNLTNINAVNSNKTNIDTVAGSISNVNAIATDISNINAVYADLTNIDSVAGDLTNIDNVAGDLTNIDTVVSNATNINTCATNIGNINTCATNISTINDKVSKAGDTMTGDLNIQKSTYTKYSSTYAEGGNFRVKDKNDNIVGNYMVYSNNNKNYIEMSLYDGSSSSAWLGVSKSAANNSDTAVASSGVRQSITNWAFPATTVTNLATQWGASGFTVTAPANGWCYLCIDNSGGNAVCGIDNTTKGFAQYIAPAGTNGIFVLCPAAKGDVLQVNYNTTGALQQFFFIHAIGG